MDELEPDVAKMMTNMPVTAWSQLRAMVARNLLLKRREYKKLIAEIVQPVFFLSILIVVTQILPDPKYGSFTNETATVPISLQRAILSLNGSGYPLFIVPDTDETRQFAAEMNEHWRDMFPLPSPVPVADLEFEFYASEEALEAHNRNGSQPLIHLAVVFDTPIASRSSYTIRNSPDRNPLPVPSVRYGEGANCRNASAGPPPEGVPAGDADLPDLPEFGFLCPINKYFYSDFLSVQALVEMTFVSRTLGADAIPAHLKLLSQQLFPKPPYVDPTTLQVLRFVVPFYMVLTLSQFILYLLTLIVGEKEKKIKEGLRMMGLRDSVYWGSWLVVYTVFVLLLDAFATGLLYAIGVFVNSNAGLVFLLFFVYDMSVLALAFLITPFFDRARVAGIFGAMAVSFLNLFYYIQVATGDSTPAFLYWLLALISPTGFALGMDKALLLEISTPQGAQWANLWNGPGLPLGGSIIMLVVDVVLYIALAVYLDSVLPTEYGARKSPWFCLSPSFWCGASEKRMRKRGQLNRAYDEAAEDGAYANDDIEPIPVSWRGKAAVRIRGLSKTFRPFGKPAVHAVKGLDLDVYEGQITAILGHNGAGKTTLFNMLTGMTEPTKGSAFVYGHDITDSNERLNIQRMTGICPQHDVLFDMLTPREHLAFFGRIRGVPDDQLQAQVEQTLRDIDLTAKGDTRAAKLSGGQRRKLSIGVALIGDPKIVFLDEPTAGVDPYSRRHLWNLLQQRKAGKVILLTTHFMDEADLLADRKAIVSKGQLRCLGSSLFLKNKFGLGYHLTFVLDENFHEVSPVRSLVGEYVPEAQINRHYGRELSFVLPRQYVGQFPALFAQLEACVADGRAAALGFTSYGISMTTLEEVFLKLGEEDEMEEADEGSSLSDTSTDPGKPTLTKSGGDENATWQLLNDLEVPIREKHTGQTVRALLKVRGLNMLRDPMAVFFQVFMPVAFAALGIWLGTLSTGAVKEDKQALNLDMYRADTADSPLLFHDNDAGSMAPFWNGPYASQNDVAVRTYSGDYLELLDLFDDGLSHWAAMDTRDVLNLTYGDLSVPLPRKNLRMRFNDTLLHIPPIMINSISNALLSSADQNISLSVHPLPFTNPPSVFDPGQFTSAMFIGMLFVLAPSALACEVVLDREIMARNLLRVNGLTFGVYFGTFFLVLGSMMVTTCLLIIALIFAFQLTALVTPAAIGLLTLLYVLYVPAAILFASCCSYFFKTMETAQSVFPNVSTLVGFIPYIVVMLCDVFRVGGDTSTATTLHIVFCLIDTLYIPYGILYYVNRVYFTCLITPNIDGDLVTSCDSLALSEYMTTEVILIFVALLVHIPAYFVLLIVIDVKASGGMAADAFPFLRWFSPSSSRRADTEGGWAAGAALGDDDVEGEKQRVAGLLTSAAPVAAPPVVLVHSLGKKYASAEEKGGSCCSRGGEAETATKPAVKSLSFAVDAGEVFGLLGHNGAGKTTTMKIITAEEGASHGRVQVAGHDIKSNLSEAFQALGYCPQHDALWRNITVREHMETYAAIRGVEAQHIGRVVDLFLRGLQIERHADKYAKNCSGGTRRKLSYALSMLGRPAIVLMDEPSTGMDPQSKRFLWNTISASFRGRRGAILTTHSMEEADALCSRIGIMVKGELRCLGTSQHLKNRYGSGYILEIKLKSLAAETSGEASAGDVAAARDQRRQKLTDFIKGLFSEALVKETFEDRVIFGIAQDSVVSLADTFKLLENARDELSMEEYSLSQTTLEQVFIKFAHEQEHED